MKSIDSASGCLRRPLLCWVDYPPHGKNCYAYPRYVVDNGSICEVGPDAFPDEGGVTVYLTGGYAPEDARSKNGEIVVMTINTNEMPLDDFYGKKRSGVHKYRGALNLSFQRGHSEIDFERLVKNSLSSALIQVIRVVDKEDFSTPAYDPLTLADNMELYTNLVMVASADGTYLSGPFEYDLHKDSEIVLKASDDFDSRVAKAHRSMLEVCAVNNRFNEQVVSFATLESVREFHSSNTSDLADWISDSEIVEAANRAINSARETVELSRTQWRALKNAIRSCSEETTKIHIDDVRRVRLEQVLETFEFWRNAPNAIDRIAVSLSSQQLADIILDEDNFPRFKEAVLSNEPIQEEVDAARKRLQGDLDELQVQVDGLHEQVGGKQAELDALLEEIEKAQSRRRELQDEALETKRGEVAELERRIDVLKREEERLDTHLEFLKDKRDRAEKAFGDVLDKVNDEEQISGRILESEMVRKVVAAVSGSNSAANERDVPIAETVVDDSLQSASAEEIAQVLYDRIVERSGRSYTKNEVINFLICLTQGYITTFAGKPGTGKTSLCGILAGALGLTYAQQDPRFVELSVEKGWASYKDYIGYYNPLTKQYEKTIPLAYDAMSMLDRESQLEGPHAPFVLLLDEANLSPIEHYWAPFLHACDSFANGSTLTLGGSESLSIPSWTRFLATVNFDHTTETLSPRFLDRSWVITLDPEDIDFDPAYQSPDFTEVKPLSYDKLLEAFGGDTGYRPEQTTQKTLNQIIRSCKEAHYPVSPRSQAMIIRYLSTATDLMDKSSKESQMAPLDYAVSQKILPMLSGPTDQLSDLMEGLIECCSSLTLTSRKLKQMRDAGDAYGFYQYFA